MPSTWIHGATRFVVRAHQSAGRSTVSKNNQLEQTNTRENNSDQNPPPINTTKLFERLVCGGRLILRGQHHAPMRGGKRNAAVISNPGHRADLTIRGHVDIQPKSRGKTSPHRQTKQPRPVTVPGLESKSSDRKIVWVRSPPPAFLGLLLRYPRDGVHAGHIPKCRAHICRPMPRELAEHFDAAETDAPIRGERVINRAARQIAVSRARGRADVEHSHRHLVRC